MGHSATTRRTRLASSAVALSCLVTLLLAAFAAGSTNAGTHQYCTGCTIYGNSLFTDPTPHYITLDYVHRLSGPSTGVTIAARAKYVSDGSWGSYVYSTSTEVQHGYNGTRNAWGSATNFGAGNYGFNAHVNY